MSVFCLSCLLMMRGAIWHFPSERLQLQSAAAAAQAVPPHPHLSWPVLHLCDSHWWLIYTGRCGEGRGWWRCLQEAGGVDADSLPNPFTNTLIPRYCCFFFCPPTLPPPHCFQLLCAGSGTRQWRGPNGSLEHNDGALSAHLFIVPITFHKTPGMARRLALSCAHTPLSSVCRPVDFSAEGKRIN